MKDPRIAAYRKALDALVESLDATLRLERWPAGDTPPEPLRQRAAALLDRLGAAGRLTSRPFAGAAADAARVDSMRGAMVRLDAAWVAYHSGRGADDAKRTEAQATLRAEIEEATAQAG